MHFDDFSHQLFYDGMSDELAEVGNIYISLQIEFYYCIN